VSKPVVAAKPAAPHAAARSAPAARDKAEDDSMFTTPKKAKKSKGSEYDPLNGSL
jgi:hypothetical protein